MTKEEYAEKLDEVLQEGISVEGMTREELCGLIAHRCFAMFLSFAEVTAKQHDALAKRREN